MKQLLAFPKKYEVTGKITKDRFLNSGNLTDAEKKVLELYLKNINILYDIRFLDQSEMIVLEIELTDAERGKYGLSNLVKAIAQSIPYLCMLLVRTEGVIRFFTFDRKENEFDDSRSRVRDICSSQDIIPIKEDISDGILITKLRASIANATSAEELNIEWSKLLKDCGLVLYWCGLRIGELLALSLSDIDFEGGIISVTKTYNQLSGREIISTPKTPSSVRKVSMPAFLVDELKEYIGLLYEPKEDQRIFQISKSKINSNFHKLSDQAGLKRITIHGLRHSHVSLLISKKYDIFEVSKRIGHKSVKTTQDIYGHLFDDVQKSIANDLNMIRRGGV